MIGPKLSSRMTAMVASTPVSTVGSNQPSGRPATRWPPADQRGAAGHGLGHLGFEHRHLLGSGERAEVGGLVGGVAHHESVHHVHEPVDELVVDATWT